jgi:hypothetical protein
MLTLSLVGYGITGANVSRAYFDLLYAVLGVVAVMTLRRDELLERESATSEQALSPRVSLRRQAHAVRGRGKRSLLPQEPGRT